MNDALRSLLADRPLSAEKVRRFAKDHGVPVPGEETVTFLFWGEADEVHLRHWIFGLPGAQPFDRIEGTPLWIREIELPANSRVEYKIEVVRRGHGEWVLDPLNPFHATDPFGANSVAHGPGYDPPDWVERDPNARRGSIESITIDSRAFGDRREVPIYLPARFRKTGRYPLVVVHDGSDYVRYARLRIVLDNLIERLEIPPVVAALSNPVDRLREYPGDPRHATHIAEELVPALEAKLPLIRRAESRCLLGASFGAVASLSTAWRYPGFFGRLLLQSGSFAFTDIGPHHRGPAFDPVVELINAFRKDPGKPSERVFVSCGTYESLIYENRSMIPLLQSTGMQVRFVEARDGHNWENWRDRLREGLSWLFPGPLWLTYE